VAGVRDPVKGGADDKIVVGISVDVAKRGDAEAELATKISGSIDSMVCRTCPDA
jgi:hypothetical protein